MIRWGTSHFVNLKVAARYYAAYHNGDIDAGKAAAERKLAAGEIHIGPPALKAGQRLVSFDNGMRYGIEED